MEEDSPNSDAEDPWADVDALKRVAQGYLDEHKHEAPNVRRLPAAEYGLIRGRDYMAQADEIKCTARARIESNLYGNAVGDGGVDVLSCARPKGHSGPHTSAPITKPLLRRGLKVAKWGNNERV
jgi:hypothetical protein